jgi:hypothetical protein
MNKTRPNWLNKCRLSNDASGNIILWKAGNQEPMREGPKRIPARISPTTTGCPTQLNRNPRVLEKNIIVKIWNNKSVRGFEKCIRKFSHKTAIFSFEISFSRNRNSTFFNARKIVKASNKAGIKYMIKYRNRFMQCVLFSQN